MRFEKLGCLPHGRLLSSLTCLAVGLVLGYASQDVLAQRPAPSEHSGVSVVGLGKVPEASMAAQIGLDGYVMQLREITLEPGGTIKRHDHATRPGLVWTLSGSWVEGRPGGEIEYPAGSDVAIVEDEATDHWFFNDRDEPAKVLVCDIVPAS